MHTLRLNVDNSVYLEFLSFLNHFGDNKVKIVEDIAREDFMVSSIQEVQSRVLQAEKNAKYTPHNDFWTDIDKKLESI